jgi:hypothetical protein
MKSFTQYRPEVKKEIKKNSTEYYVFVAIASHRKLDRFVGGLIKITKSLETNSIKFIALGKSFKDDYSRYEVFDLFTSYLSIETVKIDIIVTSIVGIFDKHTPILVNSFNIQNENELIEEYLSYQNKITANKTRLKPQKLDIGSGLLIADTSERVKLKIDFSEIKPHTLAIMFSANAIKKNQVRNIIYHL